VREGNSLVASLVERVNPDLAMWIGVELKFPLGENIKLNLSASQRIELSKPVSVPVYWDFFR
jgi:hypothetical protein